MKAEDFRAVPVEDIRKGCEGCTFYNQDWCSLMNRFHNLNQELVLRDGDCYGPKRFIYERVNPEQSDLDKAKQIVRDRIKELRDIRKQERDGHAIAELDLIIIDHEQTLTKMEEI